MREAESLQSCEQGKTYTQKDEAWIGEALLLVDDIVKAQPLNMLANGLRLREPKRKESVLP